MKKLTFPGKKLIVSNTKRESQWEKCIEEQVLFAGKDSFYKEGNTVILYGGDDLRKIDWNGMDAWQVLNSDLQVVGRVEEEADE